jgi:hypothetical protein
VLVWVLPLSMSAGDCPGGACGPLALRVASPDPSGRSIPEAACRPGALGVALLDLGGVSNTREAWGRSALGVSWLDRSGGGGPGYPGAALQLGFPGSVRVEQAALETCGRLALGMPGWVRAGVPFPRAGVEICAWPGFPVRTRPMAFGCAGSSIALFGASFPEYVCT